MEREKKGVGVGGLKTFFIPLFYLGVAQIE